MKANFDPITRAILGHEGGYSTDPHDPGNWTGGRVGVGTLKGTKFGIAANTFPSLDIKNLTQAQAADIYRQRYAVPVGFDDLPSGIDYVAYDGAINMGCKRSITCIQEGLGFHEDDCDGRMGPKTLESIRKAKQSDLIIRSLHAQLEFKRGLSTWPRYGAGWTNRVNDVQAKALKMAGSLPAVA
jgi:lysozyme family protein